MIRNITQFGPVFQIAFVARNFARSVKFWTETMGVGPFFLYEHYPIDSGSFRGRPAVPLDLSIAIAYWGEMQVELVVPHDEQESTYREHLNLQRDGLVHHIGIAPEDKMKAARFVEERGGQLVQALNIASRRALYYELPGPGEGPILELAEISPAFSADCDELRRLSRGWNGLDPVQMPPSRRFGM